jgi:hypothetical protein
MALVALPVIAWSVHKTVISFGDILRTVSRPLFSALVAAGIASGVHATIAGVLPALPRLVVCVSTTLAAYLIMLLYVMGEKAFYIGLLRGLKNSPATEEALASA